MLNDSLEAQTLDHRGVVYRQQGNYPRALASHQQALTLSRDIGDRAVQPRMITPYFTIRITGLRLF